MTKNAVQRWLIHAGPATPSPSRATFTSPNWSLNSHLNMKPEMTGEIVSGRMSSVRMAASPRNRLLIATAMPTPSTASIPTVHTVKSSVFGMTTVTKIESRTTAA